MGGFLLIVGFLFTFAGNFLIQECFSRWLEGEPRVAKLQSILKKILPSILFLVFTLCAAAQGKGELGQYAMQGAVIFQLTVFVGVWAFFWKADAFRTGDPVYPKDLIDRLPDEKNQSALVQERIKTQLTFRTLLMLGSITLYCVFALNGRYGVFEGLVLLVFGVIWLIWMDLREKDRKHPSILPLLNAHAIPEVGHAPLQKTKLHKLFSEKLGLIRLAPFFTIGLVAMAIGCWVLIVGVENLSRSSPELAPVIVFQLLGAPFCLYPVLLQLMSYKTIGINLGLIFDQIVLFFSIYTGVGALISPAEISPQTLSWDFPFTLALAIMLGLFLLTGRPPSHKVGILLVILYFAYSAARWL